MHPVVVICLALLFLGAGLAAKWGRLDFVTPTPALHASFAEQAKRALWFLDIGLIGGVVGGLLAAGAGGRLAMRLLAATSGKSVQGRITEADEVVGEITVGGTIGFIAFGGLFAGLVCSAIYLLLRKWLPNGLVGALVLGALLLVTLGSRVEPLRSNNTDFDLVAPAWLAVLAFAGLAFLHAVVSVAVMARVSRSLPLLAARRKVVLAYLPLAEFGLYSVACLRKSSGTSDVHGARSEASSDRSTHNVWLQPAQNSHYFAHIRSGRARVGTVPLRARFGGFVVGRRTIGRDRREGIQCSGEGLVRRRPCSSVVFPPS
jgi:hypothetical protein